MLARMLEFEVDGYRCPDYERAQRLIYRLVHLYNVVISLREPFLGPARPSLGDPGDLDSRRVLDREIPFPEIFSAN